MANGTMVVDRSHETEIADVGARPLPVTGGAGFDWLMAAFGSWLIGGLYLDGWAHIHVPALETFFTPWHAVLYSGYIAGAVALAETLRRNRRAGRRAGTRCPSATGSPSPARSSSSSAVSPTCCGTSSSGSRRASRVSSARAISCWPSAAAS